MAAFLYSDFLSNGCPEHVVSDQDHELWNQLACLLERLTGFKHKVTTACYLQSKRAIKSNSEKNLFNKHMDENIMLVYWSSCQDFIKCIPYLLVDDKDVCLPIQLEAISVYSLKPEATWLHASYLQATSVCSHSLHEVHVLCQ